MSKHICDFLHLFLVQVLYFRYIFRFICFLYVLLVQCFCRVCWCILTEQIFLDLAKMVSDNCWLNFNLFLRYFILMVFGLVFWLWIVCMNSLNWDRVFFLFLLSLIGSCFGLKVMFAFTINLILGVYILIFGQIIISDPIYERDCGGILIA